jgi:hypothetical protein
MNTDFVEKTITVKEYTTENNYTYFQLPQEEETTPAIP